MRVIWSDETKIKRTNSDGIDYRWVRSSESLASLAAQLSSGDAWDGLVLAGHNSVTQGIMNDESFVDILNSGPTNHRFATTEIFTISKR